MQIHWRCGFPLQAGKHQDDTMMRKMVTDYNRLDDESKQQKTKIKDLELRWGSQYFMSFAAIVFVKLFLTGLTFIMALDLD